MLPPESTALLVIDVQGKLAHSVHNREALFENLQKVIRGVQVMDIPIVWTEQYPEGLGSTIPEIAQLIDQPQPLTKTSFSCCGSQPIVEKLKQLNRPQLLVCGIEAHICVYQSVMELLTHGYQIEVITDAISARKLYDKELGLQKMVLAGAAPTSTEMCLFELIKDARSPRFKKILEIVK